MQQFERTSRMGSSGVPLTDVSAGSRQDEMNLGTGASLAFSLTQHLGRQIVGGLYPPGSTLPNEAQISTSFATGRGAVREAVKMLTAKGLVDTRPRRGTQVLPQREWNFFDRDVLSWLREDDPSPGVIAELLQLRLGIEPLAANLAAANGTDDEIGAIATALARMRAAGEGKADPVSADAAFHEAIIAATHNRFFQPFGALIQTALTITAPTTNMIFGHSVGDLDAHKKVLDCIQKRDASKAEASMRAMLEAVRDEVLAWHAKTGSGKRRPARTTRR